MAPNWLEWVQQLRAIANIGLTYSENPYDIERYEQIRSIAAQIAAQQTDVAPAVILNLFQDVPDYPTPKVDIRGAVFKDDKILMVKESIDGRWALPGGWADVGDTPSLAIEREVKEESGLTVKTKKLAAIFDRNKHAHNPYPKHIYKLFFICDLVEGIEATAFDILDVAYFAEDSLPELSSGRVTAYQIERMFAHYRNPTLPADFD